MANQKNGTIYTGVTTHIETRVREHKTSYYKGFSAKYNCKNLVRYQNFEDINEAILYEKKIKGRLRVKKLALIELHNPSREDLAKEWYQ